MMISPAGTAKSNTKAKINNKSSKSRHKINVCGECGESHTSGWESHWKRRHPGKEKTTLENGMIPPTPSAKWLEHMKEKCPDNTYIPQANHDKEEIKE